MWIDDQPTNEPTPNTQGVAKAQAWAEAHVGRWLTWLAEAKETDRMKVRTWGVEGWVDGLLNSSGGFGSSFL